MNWLEHEISKVRDPKRRTFLRQHFSGEDGLGRFYAMRRSGKGAVEFEDGTWPAKLPKLTEKYIRSRRRPCVGCRMPINPVVKPWPELYEDFTPICQTCQDILNSITTDIVVETNNSDTDPLKVAQAAREEINQAVAILKGHLVKKMGEARRIFNFLTSEQINVSPNTLLKEISEDLKAFDVL